MLEVLFGIGLLAWAAIAMLLAGLCAVSARAERSSAETLRRGRSRRSAVRPARGGSAA